MTSATTSPVAPRAAADTEDEPAQPPAGTELSIADRIADLAPQWRWLLRRVDAYGWHGFALNDPGTTLPNDDGTRKDASKMPRWSCKDCRTAKKERGLRTATCLAECGHRECHGLLGATADIDDLIGRARKHPRANTAARTGKVSNLWVLDLDGEAGRLWREQMEVVHGPIETMEFETGSGGTHLVFEYPDRPHRFHPQGEWRLNAGKIAEGVDIRGDGGLIVCPGSRSAKGPYRVRMNVVRTQPPEWLLAEVEAADEAAASKRPAVVVTGPPADDATIAAQRAAAPGGVHPYAAKTFEGRIADFRALTTVGSDRSSKLTGAAMYLARLATASPPTGLTEDAVRAALQDACDANGFTAEHGAAYRDGQIDSGLLSGRGQQPRNWPPRALEPRMSEYERDILAVLLTGDEELIEQMTDIAGEVDVERVRAKHRGGAGLLTEPDAVADAAPDAGLLTEPDAATDDADDAGLLTEPEPATDAATDDTDLSATATYNRNHDPEHRAKVRQNRNLPALSARQHRLLNTVGPDKAKYNDADAMLFEHQDTGRITIVTTGEFSTVRQDIQRAVLLTDDLQPWAYRHGGDLVEPDPEEGELTQLAEVLFVSRCADRFLFRKWKRNDTTGDYELKPSEIPMFALKAIHADTARLALSKVDRVAHTPFYGADGTLQDTAGYHAGSRTLYIPEPGVDIPDIPAKPTAAQTEEALDLIIDDLLGDFPFVGDREPDPFRPGKTRAVRATNAELAGALALMLTPFVRSMINGPTPLFAIDAPTEGTGKGLLLEALLVPSAGRTFSIAAAPTEMKEWHKQIVATLRSGPVAAIFDNVNHRLDSGALASAVTAWPNFHGRILGVSDNEKMPVPSVWACTGNNVTASREVARRIVRSRIDSGLEVPDERTYRHSALREWFTDNHGRIIGACLTLVQAWVADGAKPAEKLPRMGSFESWVKVLGSILAFHKVEGLLTNRETLTDQFTTDGDTWRPLVEMMRIELDAAERAARGEQVPERAEVDVAGSHKPLDGWRVEWTATQLAGALSAGDIPSPVDLTDGKLSTQAKRLGSALTKQRDRRFGDYALRSRVLAGSNLWRLERVS